MWKKIWSDPVGSKIISTGLLGIAALAGSYFLDWWSVVRSVLTSIWTFALAKTLTPNWLLAVLIGLGGLVLFVLCVMLWQWMRPESPNWRSYVEDQFFGIRWRWRYGSTGAILGMHTFCPHCDFQIFPSNASAYSVVERIAFHCECCNSRIGEFSESFGSLQNKAERFVQQKLRNNTWRELAAN